MRARRLLITLAATLLAGAVLATAAPAHQLPKSFARDQAFRLMNRICHEDSRPCRGVSIQQCVRKSAHRVDCRAAHRFVENGVDKTCRMWVTSRLRGSIVTTHILRATVKCRPD